MHRMIPTLPIARQLSVWKISVKIQWIEEYGIQGVSQPLEYKPNSFKWSTGFSKGPILTKYEAHNMGYTGIVLASYVNSHYNCTIRNFPFFTGLAMPVNGGVNPILFVDQLVSPGAAYSQKYGIQGVRQLRSYYSLCNSIWCISYLLARLATCIYVHCQVISASDNIYSSLFLTIKKGRLYRFWIYIYKHTYGNLNASSEPTT